MPTQCRVWDMHQARCFLCDWVADEIHSDRVAAAADAREHRRTPGHQNRLRESWTARQARERGEPAPQADVPG